MVNKVNSSNVLEGRRVEVAMADFNTFIATAGNSGWEIRNLQNMSLACVLRTSVRISPLLDGRSNVTEMGGSELHGVMTQKAGILTATAT
jgi:hypothetical protein